jgi:hypothetical protein
MSRKFYTAVETVDVDDWINPNQAQRRASHKDKTIGVRDEHSHLSPPPDEVHDSSSSAESVKAVSTIVEEVNAGSVRVPSSGVSGGGRACSAWSASVGLVCLGGWVGLVGLGRLGRP